MIAALNIITQATNNITILKSSFFTTPLRVANITENKQAHALRLMLVSSSPGILDRDEYRINVTLGEGSAVELCTQSYQRIFTMKHQASQRMEVHMAPNSFLSYLPHPTVPHTDAVFKSVNRVYVGENCGLVFGEIITCGRKLNGEIFQFKKYHSLTEIYLLGKLVIKENLLVAPGEIDLQAIGQMEGYTHQATLIYLHPEAAVQMISTTLVNFLETQAGIQFGVTLAPVNGIIIRLLGQKAEQLYYCLNCLAQLLPQNSLIKHI